MNEVTKKDIMQIKIFGGLAFGAPLLGAIVLGIAEMF